MELLLTSETIDGADKLIHLRTMFDADYNPDYKPHEINMYHILQLVARSFETQSIHLHLLQKRKANSRDRQVEIFGLLHERPRSGDPNRFHWFIPLLHEGERLCQYRIVSSTRG